MKAFQFRLDPLLTLRSWEAERARSAFGEAMAKQRELEVELNTVQSHLEAGFSAWEKTSTAGDRMHMWQHIEVLRDRQEKTADELSKASAEREEKAQLLLEAHHRVETLQSLKNKRREAHVANQRRREEVELDEIVSARFQPDI